MNTQRSSETDREPGKGGTAFFDPGVDEHVPEVVCRATAGQAQIALAAAGINKIYQQTAVETQTCPLEHVIGYPFCLASCAIGDIITNNTSSG